MTALTWSHAQAEIPDAGLAVRRDADAAELRALAGALAVLSCPALRAEYAIRRIGEARYLMTGHVRGAVTQACVVTLEPVEQQIDERILVEVAADAPAGAAGERGDRAVLAEEAEVEPLVGGCIEAGRIVFETFAAAVDPYPRKEGATFDWRDPASGSGAGGPFASLARLKTRG
jgi:hypothetical protein